MQSKEGISKSDLGQLQQSMTWFGEHYEVAEAVPVIIHPHAKAGPTASVPVGTKVMTPNDLKAFNKAIGLFVRALARDEGAVRDVERIATLLSEYDLQAEVILDRFTRDIG